MKMYKELNVQELLAELEAYRWRDKKALIMKELGDILYIGSYKRGEKIKAYKEQRWITFMTLCSITDAIDTLMLQGYTFDEIVRAIKERIAKILESDGE